MLDWFEVDLGVTELLFIQIDLYFMGVFVLYSPERESVCVYASRPLSENHLRVYVRVCVCVFMCVFREQVIVTPSTASVSIMSPTRTHGTDKIEG